MSRRKEVADLLKFVRSQEGWTVEVTGKQHYRVTGPDGPPVFVPGTPSDHRSIANVVAILRRIGLDVPR